MKEAADFFNKLKHDLVAGLYTCAIGQIERIDRELMKADIKLLPDGNLIPAVPVGTIQTDKFIIRVPYRKNDYVLIVFAQRDIDVILYEDTAEPSERMLSIDDAVIVCGINLFTRRLPLTVTNIDGTTFTAEEGDLVITTKDLKERIVLKENGGIDLFSNSDAGINIEAPMGITLRADNPAGRGIVMMDKPV